jgi:hypothetical protein
MNTDQRDEAGRDELGIRDEPVNFLAEGGHLLVATRADRMHQPSPWGELLDERRRDVGGGGRDHNRA